MQQSQIVTAAKSCAPPLQGRQQQHSCRNTFITFPSPCPQLGVCELGQPAGESQQLLNCLCVRSDRTALAGRTHPGLSRGTDTGVLCAGQDRRQPELSTFTLFPSLHVLLTHINHLLLIVTSFLWKAQKGLRSFPRPSICLSDEAFCLL